MASHLEYGRHVSAVSLATRKVGGNQVQIQRKGEVLCAQVLELWKARDSGAEFFKCRTAIGTCHVPADLVRLCSGVDGRCTCAEDGTC